MEKKQDQRVWVIAAWLLYGAAIPLYHTYTMLSGTTTPLEGAAQPTSAIFYVQAIAFPALQIITVALLLLHVSLCRWFFMALLVLSIPRTIYVIFFSGLIPEALQRSSLTSAVISIILILVITKYSFKLASSGYYRGVPTTETEEAETPEQTPPGDSLKAAPEE